MIYLGLDPGVSGGLACVDGLGRGEARAMPTTERDILDALEALAGGPARGACIAVIERVHSMPKQGHSGAFTFGRNRGRLEMALTAASIPFDEVSPQAWMKALGCLSGGDKNVTKRRAQQLFPSFEVTHALADALLIAEFNRRTSGAYGLREERTDGTVDAVDADDGDRRQRSRAGVRTDPGADGTADNAGDRADRASQRGRGVHVPAVGRPAAGRRRAGA